MPDGYTMDARPVYAPCSNHNGPEDHFYRVGADDCDGDGRSSCVKITTLPADALILCSSESDVRGDSTFLCELERGHDGACVWLPNA